MEKSGGIHACLGPSDLVGIVVKPMETWIGFCCESQFMLGIWHEGDWLKERFGSAQSMVKWYVEVLELVGFFIC